MANHFSTVPLFSDVESINQCAPQEKEKSDENTSEVDIISTMNYPKIDVCYQSMPILQQLSLMFDDSEKKIESMKFEIIDSINGKKNWIYNFPTDADPNEINHATLRAWSFLMSNGSDIMFTNNSRSVFWVPVFIPTNKGLVAQ